MRNPILTVGNAIPVLHELSQALGALVAEEIESGQYLRLRDQEQRTHVFEAAGAVWLETELERERVEFGFDDLQGPMVLLAVVSVLSLLATDCGDRAEKR